MLQVIDVLIGIIEAFMFPKRRREPRQSVL